MKPSLRALLLLGSLALAPVSAGAVEPDEILPEASLETRARDISAHLRCMVCQNESIDDSHAPLARDLRLLVRERLKAGDSDAAIFDYLVRRYGDFILLKPPLKAETLALWGAPLIVLIVGAAAIIANMRRREPNALAPKELSEAEAAKLKSALERDQA
ncbi:cytochrome C biogenesis protein [Methylocella silvestris BL2]|uniref:Cytochrome c-type biogenesis protein n=2 Tax=Methylocella silvestris TaxID=199596 RepID=B8EJK9_METSB|nr:cytochrome C biogenesis protein [Methylocella silvestris BL2]